MEIRAIYLPDIRYDSMVIFKKVKNRFISIEDSEFQYDECVVMSDPDWIIAVVAVEEEQVLSVR